MVRYPETASGSDAERGDLDVVLVAEHCSTHSTICSRVRPMSSLNLSVGRRVSRLVQRHQGSLRLRVPPHKN